MSFEAGTARLNLRLAALMILAILLQSGRIDAADWAFSPSVSLSERYSSNLFFSPDNPKSDFYTVLKPAFTLAGENERTKVLIDSTVTGEKFCSYDDLDNIFYDGRLNVSHRFSPRLSGDMEWRFSHDGTLQSVLDQSGLVSRWTNRYLFDLRASQAYALTEALSLKVSESASRVYYPSGDYPDADVVRIGVGPCYLLSARDTLTLNSFLSVTDYEDTSDIKEAVALLEWKRDFDETASIRLGAGCRYTRIAASMAALQLIRIDFGGEPFEPIGPGLLNKRFTLTTEDFGPVLAATVEKRWSERLTSSLSIGKDQYNNVNAQVFDRLTIGFSAKYGLSELTTAGIQARYYHNESLGEIGETTDYVSISPMIERKITENTVVRFAGAYDLQYRDYSGAGINDRHYRADRFMVWVEVKYTWPKFLSGK